MASIRTCAPGELAPAKDVAGPRGSTAKDVAGALRSGMADIPGAKPSCERGSEKNREE
jgi:hypothetical protein